MVCIAILLWRLVLIFFVIINNVAILMACLAKPMSLKTITIFLASSSELKDDREDFRIFISKQNDRLHKLGIYLQIIQWEFFLDAISDTRLQDQYNKAIEQCDIVLCLFFTKVGKYTSEEFDTAYQKFKATGKPKIWTYFKDAPYNTGSITKEISTLIAFKEKISELGHFSTKYENIDSLKNQFRDQLDMLFAEPFPPANTIAQVADNAVAPLQNNEPDINIFNELLARRLMSAISGYSPRAKKFLENATRISASWENQDRFIEPAIEVLALSFTGILGILLRKLIAIGKEEFSDTKLRKYLVNCQLTAKKSIQLLCFALISKLWDDVGSKNPVLSDEQINICKNFFDDQFEFDINSFVVLFETLIDIFEANGLDFPIKELAGFKQRLAPGSNLPEALSRLQALDQLLERPSVTVADCKDAETGLTIVLENFNFLAGYRMVSIKTIDYFEMRNREPHYLYNYTPLGMDNKSNINQEKVSYAQTPINTYVVLLYKDNYRENLNLFPFIIDVNALAVEGGSKIYFYASRNSENGSLDYCFLEDNSVFNINNTETIKSNPDMNELLLDRIKFKNIRFDYVITLFLEARKAITGLEADGYDTFGSSF